MAIKIKNLEQLKDRYDNKKYLYKDLALDLTTTRLINPDRVIPVPGTDIKASYDIQAISNSLINLLNTSPGERFLFPEYGLNLKSIIFSPITENNSKFIGDAIFNKIQTFEPRVTVELVDVIGDPDRNEYEVTIIINIPAIQTQTEINLVLDIRKQSFFSVPVQ